MCTVSWWVEESRRGLIFNRDERHGRVHGRPPERVRSKGDGAEFLAPSDPEAGGTWLGVNVHGLVAGLLNFYPHHQGELPERRSRGLLVADVLRGCRTAEEAGAVVRKAADPRRYRGFILFAMDRAHAPLAVAWDGSSCRDLDLDPVCGVLTTSSRHADRCRERREALIAGAGPDPGALRRAHLVFDPEEPGTSPLMVRDDAATDSITEIELDAAEARMGFREVRGNPPRAGETTEARLPLRAPTGR